MSSCSEGFGNIETKSLPQNEVEDGSSDGSVDAREMRLSDGVVASSISESYFG
jgi:hypothetical protein